MRILVKKAEVKVAVTLVEWKCSLAQMASAVKNYNKPFSLILKPLIMFLVGMRNEGSFCKYDGSN